MTSYAETDFELSYREHLAEGLPILTEALDTAISADASADDAVTRLARDLCFQSARLDDTEVRPPFATYRRPLMDHGVRQAALANEVWKDERIGNALPSWFDPRLFGQILITADVGLSFISDEEIERVDTYGPKHAVDYALHPEFGYQMAAHAGDLRNLGCRTLASAIGRHHILQATHPYGLEWYEMEQEGLNTSRIDILVALQKPFDYFDDYFTRDGTGEASLDDKVTKPLNRYSSTIGRTMCNNLLLVASAEQEDYDVRLPAMVAKKIGELLLSDDPNGIGAAYQQLRPDLALALQE